MRPPFLPVLLLVIVPVLGALWRWRPAGDGSRRSWRWAIWFSGAGAAAGIFVWCYPSDGVGLVAVKRLNLLVAGTATLLLAGESLGVLSRWSERRRLGAWCALAAASMLVYFDFFAFHGRRTFVHWHDVAHYVLGSKYFDELGYRRLYDAMLWAEAEAGGGGLRVTEARDLETNEMVPAAALLERGLAAKGRFTSERWRDFAADAAMFRTRLGPLYGAVLRDHGFNPTPFWALVGGGLTNALPAGKPNAIRLLALLDPLLLIGLFVTIARTRGLQTMLVAVVLFGVLFGATFGWVGGAFLRQLWLFSMVVAACALGRGRLALAGALVAIAAALRVFPLVFAAALGLKTLHDVARSRRLRHPHWRFYGALAVGLAVCFGATMLRFRNPQPWLPWLEFQRNLAKHHDTVAPNLVGLTQVLAYRPAPERVSEPEFRRIETRRTTTHRWQLVLVLPLVALLGWRRMRHLDDTQALAFGIALVFVASNLAAYYYAFLLLFIVAFARDRNRLAWLLAAETATWAVALFVENDATLHVCRSLLVAYLLAALYTRAMAPALESATIEEAPRNGRAGPPLG